MNAIRREVPLHWFPPQEERAHVLTHAAGLVLTGAAATLLLCRGLLAGASTAYTVGTAVFALTLLLLYGASTFYHYARDPDLRRRLRVLDHSSVYLLIAGTYTPFMLIFLQGPWGWSLLAAVWTLAGAGLILKYFCTGRFEAVSVTLSLTMGWLCLLAVRPMIASMPMPCFALIVAGGLSYTLGVVFYLLDSHRWFHTIWHMLVLGGSSSHIVALGMYGIR